MIRHGRRPRSLLNPRPVTPRRLSAAERALTRQRQRLPLFAEQLAAVQPRAEERIEAFEEAALESERRIRRFEAGCWRDGRRWLRNMPKPLRGRCLRRWNESSCPAEGAYFAAIIRDEARSAGVDVETLDEHQSREDMFTDAIEPIVRLRRP